MVDMWQYTSKGRESIGPSVTEMSEADILDDPRYSDYIRNELRGYGYTDEMIEDVIGRRKGEALRETHSLIARLERPEGFRLPITARPIKRIEGQEGVIGPEFSQQTGFYAEDAVLPDGRKVQIIKNVPVDEAARMADTPTGRELIGQLKSRRDILAGVQPNVYPELTAGEKEQLEIRADVVEKRRQWNQRALEEELKKGELADAGNVETYKKEIQQANEELEDIGREYARQGKQIFGVPGQPQIGAPEITRMRKEMKELYPGKFTGRPFEEAGDISFEAARGWEALTPEEWDTRASAYHGLRVGAPQMAVGGPEIARIQEQIKAAQSPPKAEATATPPEEEIGVPSEPAIGPYVRKRTGDPIESLTMAGHLTSRQGERVRKVAEMPEGMEANVAALGSASADPEVRGAIQSGFGERVMRNAPDDPEVEATVLGYLSMDNGLRRAERYAETLAEEATTGNLGRLDETIERVQEAAAAIKTLVRYSERGRKLYANFIKKIGRKYIKALEAQMALAEEEE